MFLFLKAALRAVVFNREPIFSLRTFGEVWRHLFQLGGRVLPASIGKVRNVVQHHTTHRIAPTKKDLTQNANSAKAEKPCSRVYKIHLKLTSETVFLRYSITSCNIRIFQQFHYIFSFLSCYCCHTPVAVKLSLTNLLI